MKAFVLLANLHSVVICFTRDIMAGVISAFACSQFIVGMSV